MKNKLIEVLKEILGENFKNIDCVELETQTIFEKVYKVKSKIHNKSVRIILNKSQDTNFEKSINVQMKHLKCYFED